MFTVNVLFMTNTYLPIVGGLERSVECFSAMLRQKGHKTLIIAPEFENQPETEEHVFRVPAIQNFNGTDFSVQLPAPRELNKKLERFKPDIIHSQHPFLIGDTAVRLARAYNIPMVFTYHTRYEMNTHYLPGDSEILKKFVRKLAIGYCHLANRVIAPSESIAKLINDRGFTRQVDIVPTGIEVDKFRKGDGETFRRSADIPDKAFLTGYLGRIAEEKNLGFLCEAMVRVMEQNANVHFLLVGGGPYLEDLKKLFRKKNLSERLHAPGVCKGEKLVGAYKAMDLFVFASKSETQGLVLAEAMAAGTPVIGVDAPGTRDIVREGYNGRLVSEDIGKFADAAERFLSPANGEKETMIDNAKRTAEEFALEECFDKLLKVYENVFSEHKKNAASQDGKLWERSKREIKAELSLVKNMLEATGSAITQVYEKEGTG